MSAVQLFRSVIMNLFLIVFFKISLEQLKENAKLGEFIVTISYIIRHSMTQWSDFLTCISQYLLTKA